MILRAQNFVGTLIIGAVPEATFNRAQAERKLWLRLTTRLLRRNA